MAQNTPELLDLTIDNITPNTVRINSQSDNARLKYLMERLVTHLHDFARETRLSTDEWMAALNFLVGCGQISSDVRHEFILLSDILGLSLLVDSINHPKPPDSTEGSVLGPFHTHDAPTLENGANMSGDPEGEPLLVVCKIKDRQGNPISGVKIDIWETDSSGHYDVQHEGRTEASERCVMISDKEGRFFFQGIKPVSYPIPHDGPVGKLLSLLGRHCWRPAHLHFMFQKEGWDHLITALYIRGDPYEKSDAVFGVKKSLVVDLDKVDKATAEEYSVKEGSWLLKQDFVLVSEKETQELRDRNAIEALGKLGLTHLKLVDHLPYSETALTPSVAKLPTIVTQPVSQGHPRTDEFMSIENLKSYDPFAEADEDTGETKQSQNYIHIRIQQRNGRKTLTTVQGLPKKFDQKKILKVIKKQFACNGTIVADSEMGEVIQLQGDQRKVVQEFLINTKEGLGLDSKTIKVHGF
ncbi:dioxygenase [Colletotrichum fioriniae PJ7]|uniref:Dioxygenase n=5 Tax=Colletotrichum acutatum species complex TaxID=2707335 RepID=A0A010S520_9PEZI|nr:dioxygenase [Colletotrichum fioriniae PJ7]